MINAFKAAFAGAIQLFRATRLLYKPGVYTRTMATKEEGEKRFFFSLSPSLGVGGQRFTAVRARLIPLVVSQKSSQSNQYLASPPIVPRVDHQHPKLHIDQTFYVSARCLTGGQRFIKSLWVRHAYGRPPKETFRRKKREKDIKQTS